MEIHPVRRYRQPRYPTTRILEEHPELLGLVPKRWQSKPVVISALTGICMLMYGSQAVQGKAAPPKSLVAPIFVHGDGRGSFGCVATNPPVFLSEEEARQVIVEEAKKSKIELKPDVLTLPEFSVSITNRFGSVVKRNEGSKTDPPTPIVQPLELDGTDAKHKISYEVVSGADFIDWMDKGIWGNGSSVDLAKAAGLLRSGLIKAKPEGTYAVFYDPTIGARKLSTRRPEKYKEIMEIKDYRKRSEAMRIEMQEIAREDLRTQVKDFIKWLKAEGVI